MTTRSLSTAEDNFNRLRAVFRDLEKSSTRSNTAVQTLFAHLQTCVAYLFVEEEEPEYRGGGKNLKAGDNWQSDYYTLMREVTAELKTAYDQYESENSGGLPYATYERFVDVLGRCRSWMKQTEVVLTSKEDYARRRPVQPPDIRQEAGPPRGHESAALSTLQDEVRDLRAQLTKLFDANVENHMLWTKQTTPNLQFSQRIAALEQLAPAIARFEAHEASYNTLPASQATIAQLLSRVAALERPWHHKFTSTKPRASDPPGSTPPATNMTALLRRPYIQTYIHTYINAHIHIYLRIYMPYADVC